MTCQGTSPSLLTYMPPKNTTTMMTTILPGLYQGGSYPPWGGVAPPSLHSAAHLTNSPSTIGASWPRLTTTRPWTSSAKRCAARSTSLNRRSKWLEWSEVSAKGDLKPPEPTAKSAICGWVKPGCVKSKTELGQTWCTRINKLDMDVGIHSDKERGVTGLGQVQPL